MDRQSELLYQHRASVCWRASVSVLARDKCTSTKHIATWNIADHYVHMWNSRHISKTVQDTT